MGLEIYFNRPEKEMRYKISKRRVLLSLLIDDLIFYLKNPTESREKLLQIIGELRKRVVYKINTKK